MGANLVGLYLIEDKRWLAQSERQFLVRVARVIREVRLDQYPLTIALKPGPSLVHDLKVSNRVGDHKEFSLDYGLRRGGPHGLLNS